MTFSLEHVKIKDDSPVACVVRNDDGLFMQLRDASLLMELSSSDPEGYAMLMSIAQKMLGVTGVALTA